MNLGYAGAGEHPYAVSTSELYSHRVWANRGVPRPIVVHSNVFRAVPMKNHHAYQQPASSLKYFHIGIEHVSAELVLTTAVLGTLAR